MLKSLLKIQIVVLVAVLTVGASVYAKKAKTNTPKLSEEQKQLLVTLNETMDRYRKTVAVESKLKQEVSNILDQTTISEGKIWLSQGKMKIRFEKPEQVDVIYDGEWLWQAQKAPEEFGGQWQVIKMKTKDLRKSNAAVALLFGKGQVEAKFSVTEMKKNKENKDQISYLLKPKDTKNSSLNKIKVVISTEDKKVIQIDLEDLAETKTKLIFADTTFGAEVNDKMFKYNPPKGAEVNTL